MAESKSQVDRLGERLRSDEATESDLRRLDDYRRLFGDAYDSVVKTIRGSLGLEPTGRPAKSTTSIVEKLRRETIRLSQIQDISGCRLIVRDLAEQDQVVASLVEKLPAATVVDRRQEPSHGYRAVHVIVAERGLLVEVQVRTELQHLWAELSEKLSDVVDPSIKYGGGVEKWRKPLDVASVAVARKEQLEREVNEFEDSEGKDKIVADLRGERDLLRVELTRAIAAFDREAR